LTVQHVEGLAPDTASIKAGRKLAAEKHWIDLGHDDAALWGQCQGSALYQTGVDRTDLTARCSCPDRKFPCKHALGLLLLAATAPDAFENSNQPQWVADWLTRCTERAVKSAERVERPATSPVHPEAHAKRALDRQRNVRDGIERLDRWMEDIVRQGIARLEVGGQHAVEQQARRLVDAQAPGLAGRVREICALISSGDGWPVRVLEALGQLRWITEAFRNIDHLDPGLAYDVRQVVGLALSRDDVISYGDTVADDLLVLGQTHERESNLHVQRTYLLGRSSGRYALILQSAPAGCPSRRPLRWA